MICPFFLIDQLGFGKPDVPRQNLTLRQDVSGTEVESVEDKLVEVPDNLVGAGLVHDAADLDLQVGNTVGFIPMAGKLGNGKVRVGTVKEREERLVGLSFLVCVYLDGVFLGEGRPNLLRHLARR